MFDEIKITPWWLRLIGRKPFRRKWSISDYWDWEYLSLREALLALKDAPHDD